MRTKPKRSGTCWQVVVDDIDIWRSAKLLIDQHGDEAPIHAAMRADELLAAGDLDGYAAWKRIVRAVDDLLRVERDAEHVH